METELKLRVSQADIAMLREQIAQTGTCRARAAHWLDARYVDTSDCALARQGMSLRVRSDGSQWVQTLKTGRAAFGGLHQCEEWESVVADDRIDIDKLRSAPMEDLQHVEQVYPQLRVIFHTRFHRETCLLEFAYHPFRTALIEVALDQGEIVLQGGAGRETICELELELKAGPASALFDLALLWNEAVCLIPYSVNKSARGYRLMQNFDAFDIKPLKAEALAPAAKTGGRLAWLGGLRGYLAQIEGNCDAIALAAPFDAPLDEEFVHQARVAVRRLRASLRFLRRLSGLAYPAQLDAELKYLFASLGHARDWDVFIGGALAQLPSDGGAPDGLQTIRQAAAEARVRAYEGLRTVLNSARYGCLLLGAAKLLLDGESALKKHRIARQDARALLHCQHRQLLRDVKKVRGSMLEEWHQLRIDIKKLRYSSEFFAAILQDKGARRYNKALIRAQESLGCLNDWAQAMRLVSELFDAAVIDARQFRFVSAHFSSQLSLLRRPAWKKIAALARVDEPWE